MISPQIFFFALLLFAVSTKTEISKPKHAHSEGTDFEKYFLLFRNESVVVTVSNTSTSIIEPVKIKRIDQEQEKVTDKLVKESKLEEKLEDATSPSLKEDQNTASSFDSEKKPKFLPGEYSLAHKPKDKSFREQLEGSQGVDKKNLGEQDEGQEKEVFTIPEDRIQKTVKLLPNALKHQVKQSEKQTLDATTEGGDDDAVLNPTDPGELEGGPEVREPHNPFVFFSPVNKFQRRRPRVFLEPLWYQPPTHSGFLIPTHFYPTAQDLIVSHKFGTRLHSRFPTVETFVGSPEIKEGEPFPGSWKPLTVGEINKIKSGSKNKLEEKNQSTDDENVEIITKTPGISDSEGTTENNVDESKQSRENAPTGSDEPTFIAPFKPFSKAPGQSFNAVVTTVVKVKYGENEKNTNDKADQAITSSDKTANAEETTSVTESSSKDKSESAKVLTNAHNAGPSGRDWSLRFTEGESGTAKNADIVQVTESEPVRSTDSSTEPSENSNEKHSKEFHYNGTFHTIAENGQREDFGNHSPPKTRRPPPYYGGDQSENQRGGYSPIAIQPYQTWYDPTESYFPNVFTNAAYSTLSRNRRVHPGETTHAVTTSTHAVTTSVKPKSQEANTEFPSSTENEVDGTGAQKTEEPTEPTVSIASDKPTQKIYLRITSKHKSNDQSQLHSATEGKQRIGKEEGNRHVKQETTQESPNRLQSQNAPDGKQQVLYPQHHQYDATEPESQKPDKHIFFQKVADRRNPVPDQQQPHQHGTPEPDRHVKQGSTQERPNIQQFQSAPEGRHRVPYPQRIQYHAPESERKDFDKHVQIQNEPDRKNPVSDQQQHHPYGTSEHDQKDSNKNAHFQTLPDGKHAVPDQRINQYGAPNTVQKHPGEHTHFQNAPDQEHREPEMQRNQYGVPEHTIPEQQNTRITETQNAPDNTHAVPELNRHQHHQYGVPESQQNAPESHKSFQKLPGRLHAVHKERHQYDAQKTEEKEPKEYHHHQNEHPNIPEEQQEYLKPEKTVPHNEHENNQPIHHPGTDPSFRESGPDIPIYNPGTDPSLTNTRPGISSQRPGAFPSFVNINPDIQSHHPRIDPGMITTMPNFPNYHPETDSDSANTTPDTQDHITNTNPSFGNTSPNAPNDFPNTTPDTQNHITNTNPSFANTSPNAPYEFPNTTPDTQNHITNTNPGYANTRPNTPNDFPNTTPDTQNHITKVNPSFANANPNIPNDENDFHQIPEEVNMQDAHPHQDEEHRRIPPQPPNQFSHQDRQLQINHGTFTPHPSGQFQNSQIPQRNNYADYTPEYMNIFPNQGNFGLRTSSPFNHDRRPNQNRFRSNGPIEFNLNGNTPPNQRLHSNNRNRFNRPLLPPHNNAEFRHFPRENPRNVPKENHREGPTVHVGPVINGDIVDNPFRGQQINRPPLMVDLDQWLKENGGQQAPSPVPQIQNPIMELNQMLNHNVPKHVEPSNQRHPNGPRGILENNNQNENHPRPHNVSPTLNLNELFNLGEMNNPRDETESNRESSTLDLNQLLSGRPQKLPGNVRVIYLDGRKPFRPNQLPLIRTPSPSRQRPTQNRGFGFPRMSETPPFLTEQNRGLNPQFPRNEGVISLPFQNNAGPPAEFNAPLPGTEIRRPGVRLQSLRHLPTRPPSAHHLENPVQQLEMPPLQLMQAKRPPRRMRGPARPGGKKKNLVLVVVIDPDTLAMQRRISKDSDSSVPS